MMSANFRIEEKVDKLIDLLMQSNVKGNKNLRFVLKFL